MQTYNTESPWKGGKSSFYYDVKSLSKEVYI